ncbi:hypothetical protein BJV82DRAFT_670923 [Fennellomyces sp. T-0311]|nr:hypothetical protein BJV82DRAFT_670923 [Fennellomyces sp. T-0311]
MAEALVSLPTNAWSIQDVILDSPVWKSNILHLEEQIDHFEKWVEGFMKSLKQYVDAVIKYNAQTSNLCKKILPQNLDGSLIDPQVAGMIINTFASTLQCNLAFKTKLVSDLEDNLLHPLQRFVKHELKDFKEARKAYERMSDKYEAQMYRYGALSRAKEPSALREDAFQTYDVRKTFTRVSRDYFTQLLAFKANIEHVLVECFSCAMAAQIEEADEAYQSCSPSRAMLPGWQQWLEESKAMGEYQLAKISKASRTLETAAIRKARPHRSLRNYITPINSSVAQSSPAAADDSPFESSPSPRTSQISSYDDPPSSSKEGYLFTRVVVGKPARYSWIRRWYFVQDGWFGASTVSTVGKVKGCVVVSDRVRVSDCTCRTNNEIDRRFLFEVVTSSNSAMLLQAENEDEMQEWIRTIEYAAKQPQPKDTSTTPAPLLSAKQSLQVIQSGSGPVVVSNSPLLTALGSPSRERVSVTTTMSQLVSVLIGNEFSIASTSIHDGEPVPDDNGPTQTPSSPASGSSWSMPWIMSGFNALASGSNTDVSFYGNENSMARGDDGGFIIWPTRIEMDAPVVCLKGYTGELASRQRELRRLFAHVPESETVIEAFSASLYRQSGAHPDTDSDDGAGSPVQQSNFAIANEYAYSGRGYVTQTHLWFYHSALMTCINTVVIQLNDIKSVRLEKALSNLSHGMLMFVETKSTPPKTFCFGIWLEPAEVVGERLKLAIEGAKDVNKVDIQQLYDQMRAVVPGKIKPKRPTSHVMRTRTLDAAVTPVTVQAHPPSPQQQPSTETRTTPMKQEEVEEPERPSAAAGALTAAMEAATSSSGNSGPSTSTSTSTHGEQPSKKSTDSYPNDQDKPLPPGPVQCDCADHLDKIEAKVTLPCSAQKLFHYMFSDKQSGQAAGKNSIWAKLNAEKQNSDPDITNWATNEEGYKERTLKYVMPLNNPMVKTRDTDVLETQRIITESHRLCYVVVSSTKTPSLPYADAFVPCIKFCITYLSPTSCQLSCCMGVKWLKSIMVKSMVSRAATKGMTDTIRALVPLIENEAAHLDEPKGQAMDKRRRSLPPPPTPRTERRPSMSARKQGLYLSVSRIFTVCVITLFLYAMFKKFHHPLTSTPAQPDASSTVVWRAVFLRDIEDGLIDNNNTAGTLPVLQHVNPKLYRTFEQHRNSKWFSMRHQLMGAELTYTRERLGALRYELLTAFRMLNMMDQRILENEYWNWVFDERLRCENATDNDVCSEIIKEAELS